MRIPIRHIEIKVDVPGVPLLKTQGYRVTDRDGVTDYRWLGRRWIIDHNPGRRGDVKPVLEPCEALIPQSVVKARENADYKVLKLLEDLKLRAEYAASMSRDATEMRAEVKALVEQIEAEMIKLVTTSAPQLRRKLS